MGCQNLLNYIWAAMVLISIVFSFFNGTTQEVSQAVLQGAQKAVELVFSMLGMMCLWSGLMKIAEYGGMTKALSRVFNPVLSRLFPKYKHEPETMGAISSNVTANLLGLGNAATPLGLEAMKRMHKSENKPIANNSMIMFVVINTASIQLIPTTISVIRQSAGASVPMDIAPCIWISSAFALIVGVSAAKIMERRD